METLRDDPLKEMNDRCNKWIMFSKSLERKVQKRGMMSVGSRYLHSIDWQM